MNPKRAFTLVEILVVIVIIGILVTLVTLAVAGAQRSAKRARIAVEMSRIAMALEQYKNEFGEYPPDMFDDEALVRHVKKRFPRFAVAGTTTTQQAGNIRKAIDNVYQNTAVYPNGWHGKGASVYINMETNASAITSLSLWLGGFVQPNGKMAGFDADSEAPFGKKQDDSVNDGVSEYTDVSIRTPDKKTFLELEVGKNIAFPVTTSRPSTFPSLVSQLNSDTFVPILYFKGKSGGGANAYSGSFAGTASKLDSYNFSVLQDNFGTASAYAKKGTTTTDTNLEWIEPEKYQLIHPGLDGKFDSAGSSGNVSDDSYFHSLETLSPADRDNITNFSDFKEIQSILP